MPWTDGSQGRIGGRARHCHIPFLRDTMPQIARETAGAADLKDQGFAASTHTSVCWKDDR